jgi:hypothetical protein
MKTMTAPPETWNLPWNSEIRIPTHLYIKDVLPPPTLRRASASRTVRPTVALSTNNRVPDEVHGARTPRLHRWAVWIIKPLNYENLGFGLPRSSLSRGVTRVTTMIWGNGKTSYNELELIYFVRSWWRHHLFIKKLNKNVLLNSNENVECAVLGYDVLILRQTTKSPKTTLTKTARSSPTNPLHLLPVAS